MTNRKLIALAREHATYDIPYSTIQLLNDLADALELVEAEKHFEQFLDMLPDDIGPIIPPLDAPDEDEVMLLQKLCNPPTQEEVIARQERAEREIKEAKLKWFGHI